MTHGNWNTAADSELLEACRNGETEAYAVLWERHHRAGEAAARGIAPTLDAGDLVSGAYLKILELIADGRGPTGAFRPYLYRVIRTLAADTYRSPEESSDELDAIPDLTEAGPWEDGAFDRNAAAQAFAGLNERWQAVLWYTVVEGMPPREAAVLLGMSANSVSALASRAREALQSGWVEAHVNRELAAAECQTTLANLQRYERGKLTAALRRDVEAHLDHCETCPRAVAEYSFLNQKLALVLASLFVGGGAAGSLLGAFGQSAPAMAATAVAAGSGSSGVSASALPAAGGSTGSAGSGGLGTGGSTLAGVITGPVGIIAGVAAAAIAVIAGGAIVLANVLGGGGSDATAVEASTSEVQPESKPSAKPETVEPKSSTPAPDTDAPVAEVPEIVDPDPAVPTDPNRDPGVSTPVPSVDPVPTPTPTPDPEPEPEPEPEPQVDPTLLPGAPVCSSSQNGVGGTFLYGLASRALQSASIRVLPAADATPVVLPESVVRTWSGRLWMSNSVTPLSQWPGLSTAPSPLDPVAPSILEIQVTDLAGKVSPWTRIDMSGCMP